MLIPLRFQVLQVHGILAEAQNKIQGSPALYVEFLLLCLL